MDKIECVIISVLFMVLLLVSFQGGREYVYREMCLKNKGHYSFDYSECVYE